MTGKWRDIAADLCEGAAKIAAIAACVFLFDAMWSSVFLAALAALRETT